MDGRKDFTIDRNNFGDLADYFHELRANHNMKTIIILVRIAALYRNIILWLNEITLRGVDVDFLRY